MGRFRVRRLLLAGAMAFSVAVGVAAVAEFDEMGTAFAQVVNPNGETELDGVVEAMPATGLIGTWQVSGRTVVVTDATEIDQEEGPLAVGALVEVEGKEQPDGSILARDLEVEDEDD
ncbi:MAG: hypothetical protein IT306_17660 [Chloroflexi bacterium]|nr:hypothetical protein [Chloroflexota bacterium]